MAHQDPDSPLAGSFLIAPHAATSSEHRLARRQDQQPQNTKRTLKEEKRDNKLTTLAWKVMQKMIVGADDDGRLSYSSKFGKSTFFLHSLSH